MATSGEDPAQCFVSYHRPDNDTYDGVVDRLASEIQGRFAAETGRELQVFLDRESIPGGTDWREKIYQSIASATIFIPVVTMRYFLSENCREELLAFYDGAQKLGVTELILPVVLAGGASITAHDPRPEVRLIERLNYRSIAEAADAGYQSPEWKASVRTLVTDIARGLAMAEQSIVRGEAEESGGGGPGTPVGVEILPAPGAHESGDMAAFEPDDDDDILEMGTKIEAVTQRAQNLSDAMEELGTVVGSFSNDINRVTKGSTAEQRALLLRLAHAIQPVAERVGLEGAAMESGVRSIDKQIRSVVGELESIDGPMASQLREQLVTPFEAMDTGDTMDRMDSMIGTLSAFAVLSVSLRKALQPAVRGVRAARNAISISNSWAGLAHR